MCAWDHETLKLKHILYNIKIVILLTWIDCIICHQSPKTLLTEVAYRHKLFAAFRRTRCVRWCCSAESRPHLIKMLRDSFSFISRIQVRLEPTCSVTSLPSSLAGNETSLVLPMWKSVSERDWGTDSSISRKMMLLLSSNPWSGLILFLHSSISVDCSVALPRQNSMISCWISASKWN